MSTAWSNEYLLNDEATVMNITKIITSCMNVLHNHTNATIADGSKNNHNKDSNQEEQ